MSAPCFRLSPHLPPVEEVIAYIRQRNAPTVAARMAQAGETGATLVQPRCGVGGMTEMLQLLQTLEQEAAPDVLTLTIDSHTRLERFGRATEVLRDDPSRLNGFPLVSHGYQAVRKLAESIETPLQVRHGSPDGRRLFAESLAAGLSSFEGGPIGYNLPYCKDISIEKSIAAWAEIDEMAAHFTQAGIPVEREMFGSLTGVAVPPSIALACTFLEAILAAGQGVKSISIAIPQAGYLVQDIAALRCIPMLAQRWLPADTTVHPVLHQFMGVFPVGRASADGLIFSGGLAGYYGGAHKIICKTYHEAIGVPTAQANAAGLRLTRAALSGKLAILPLPESAIEMEMQQILAETQEIVDPILSDPNLSKSISQALEKGFLDIPFPANDIAKGKVYPVRDENGALRFGATGNLPFTEKTRRAAISLSSDRFPTLSDAVRDALFYFSTLKA